MALGVFMLAFGGLVVALEAALDAGLSAREAASMRRELENRLAFCLAHPPAPGEKRILEAKDNRGFRVEESLEPWPASNQKGEELQGLFKLKIQVEAGRAREDASVLLYNP